MVCGREPVQESMQRLKASVRELLVPSNNEPWQDVRYTLNRTLRRSSHYFCHRTQLPAFLSIYFYVL